MNELTTLDADELLGLALNALRMGDHGSALNHLKQGAERFPEDARIAYLLGAEHAQIGLFDRAEVEMARAIELDPTLYTACFQLGLLRATQGRADEARTTWQGLDALPGEHALRLFAQGLDALALNDLAGARELLQQGVQANNFSPDLNRDMNNVLSRIGTETEAVQEVVAESEASPLWLNAYRNTDTSH